MNLGQEYLLLTFVGCCGVLQLAAAFSGLKGMLIAGDRRFSIVVGALLVAGALIWFFWEGGRNLPDTGGGIAGASQFYFFMLGGFLALLTTFLFTSLTNVSRKPSDDTPEGLPTLKETTYLYALARNLIRDTSYLHPVMRNVKAVWKLFHRLTRKFSSG